MRNGAIMHLMAIACNKIRRMVELSDLLLFDVIPDE